MFHCIGYCNRRQKGFLLDSDYLYIKNCRWILGKVPHSFETSSINWNETVDLMNYISDPLWQILCFYVKTQDDPKWPFVWLTLKAGLIDEVQRKTTSSLENKNAGIKINFYKWNNQYLKWKNESFSGLQFLHLRCDKCTQ